MPPHGARDVGVNARRILIANWKMNLGVAASVELAAHMLDSLPQADVTSIWLAPSIAAIRGVAEAVKGSELTVGAQNVCGAEKGAFTGESSVMTLRELGATFAIVGHSERRHVFGESMSVVNTRMSGALAQGFTVVLCVGETEAERKSAATKQVLTQQLSAVSDVRRAHPNSPLLIAYEPVWAIGTGIVASEKQIAEAHSFIAQRRDSEGWGNVPILYGGSVSRDNFEGILGVPDVAGALVGGASLDAQHFCELAQMCARPTQSAFRPA